MSISSLREHFIIPRLLAFFGYRVANNSSGSVRLPHVFSPHLHSVMRESRTVSSVSLDCRSRVGQGCNLEDEGSTEFLMCDGKTEEDSHHWMS